MSNDSILIKHLTERSIRRLAGPLYFDRGEIYFEEDRVRNLKEADSRITAKVVGTRNYAVTLWFDEGPLDYSCSCPLGEEGAFCKHCVAVGLAWIAGNASTKKHTTKGGKRSPRSGLSLQDIRSWLTEQKKEDLADWLLAAAEENDLLRNRLLLMAARDSADSRVNLATYRESIRRALDTGDFFDRFDMYDYVRAVEEMLTSLNDLLKKGEASAVMELSEYALSQADRAMEYIDRSDSFMYGVIEQIQTLHLSACKKTAPDPLVLAEKLLEWEVEGDGETLCELAKTYSRILGKKGLNHHRKLLKAEWDKIRPLKPGEEDPARYGRRYKITSMMEKMAKESGDLPALVAVKEKDLSRSYHFLEIAQIYARGGQHQEARQWAERGLNAFPNDPHYALQDLLADEYHRSKRHEEAMSLIWSQFCRHPGLDRYKKLKKHADKIKQWPKWRTQALDHLRSRQKESKSSGGPRWRLFPRPDHSDLVEIHLWEKDLERAWQEAKAGGCHRELWFKLATLREETHPQDAINVYQTHLNSIIDLKNKDAYRKAAKLLQKIKKLMTHHGQDSDFGLYLKRVRSQHKRKRNFMALIDKIK